MGAFPWYSTVTGGRYGSFSLVLHSDLWEVWELFLGTPPIKMTTNDIAEIVVESGVKHP